MNLTNTRREQIVREKLSHRLDWIVIAQLITTAAIFAVDICFPLGWSVWIAYLFVLPTVAIRRPPQFLLHFAALWSILVALDFFLSAPGTDPQMSILNRTLFIACLGGLTLTATFYWRLQQRIAASEAELQQLNESLEQCVQDQTREIRLLAEAISNLAEGVAITNADDIHQNSRIIFVNAAMCRISGYMAHELIGQPAAVLLGKMINQNAVEQMHSELMAGRACNLELLHYRKDGTAYDAELFITPLYDHEGNLTNYVSIERDITERKQAAAALKDSEQRLRAILQGAFSAVVTIDERGSMVDANPATEKLFGYSRDELIGQNVAILMPPPFRDHHDNYLREYLQRGAHSPTGLGREIIGMRKDGTTFPAEISISYIADLKLFTGIMRDISVRKELQRHILEIASEEQQRIGQELHDGTGQELTGLAMLVQSLWDIARESTTAPDTSHPRSPGAESQAPRLDTIYQQRLEHLAQRLTRGLEQANRHVHQLSRGIMPVQIDAEGLRAALQELAAAVDQPSGIRCRFTCSSSGRIRDNATATHLYRIAQEAMNNAVRHSQATEIVTSLRYTSDSVQVEIEDNGIGFASAADAMGQAIRGGLGLQTMKYRAELIGGQLSITLNHQGHTVVRCTVPLVKE